MSLCSPTTTSLVKTQEPVPGVSCPCCEPEEPEERVPAVETFPSRSLSLLSGRVAVEPL
jgi:hypothetical protein